MRRVLAVLLLALLLAIPAASIRAQGNTYYVSPTGSDATGDGSLAHPWATPGYGSRQLQPGDALIILGGRYVVSRYDEDILMPPSGTVNAWVTIRGEAGNRPVLADRGYWVRVTEKCVLVIP